MTECVKEMERQGKSEKSNSMQTQKWTDSERKGY